jgi:hypothetical protein
VATDTSGLKGGITVEFTEDEIAMLELASDGQAPTEFLREAALSVAGGIVGNLDPDAGAPQEAHDDDGVVLPIATLDPETGPLLERVVRMEDLLREVVAIETTVLSELYAHTAFRDAAHEKECRARAEAKIAKIAPAIVRLLAAGRPAAVN